MRTAALVVPVLFSLALTLPGIERKGFLHEDEWRNAVMVREMTASGPALFPTLHGEPYPDYPPLYFLSALGVAKLQGSVTPLSLRLPAAIGAALMAFGTALLALRLASARTALVAGVLVSVIPALHYEARRAMIDPLLSGFVCVAVALMAQPTWKSFAGGCVFVALAWLTKGPLGAVMVGLALAGGEGLVFATSPSGPAWKWLQLRALIFVLVVLSIAYVWYSLAYQLHGSDFEWNLVYHQTWGRFHSIPQHAQKWWYYLVTTVPALLPVLAFCSSIRKTRLSLFAVGWFVLVLIFLSVSKTKRSYYLMPAYPAVALVAAGFFEIPFGPLVERIWSGVLEFALAAALVVGVVVGLSFGDARPYAWPLTAACLLGLIAFVALRRRGRPALGFAAAAAFVLAAVSASIVPLLAPRHGYEKLAAKLAGYKHVAISPSGAHREALCWFFAPSPTEGMPNVDGKTPEWRFHNALEWVERYPPRDACVLFHEKDWRTLSGTTQIGFSIEKVDDDPNDPMVALGN
ncbi:MAG TPA: phospholipid carrier-dependent glycosyltransferase [Planctomycetota bacterium]|nr:phospholipid carrier-dependent glycosyltransferase [Planctomycetota bacterium]